MLVPAAAVLLVLGVKASGAQASRWIQYGLQDDAWLAAGPGPNTLPARIALLEKLGVGIVRYNLPWDEIAAERPLTPADPNDPAYQWGYSDPVLDALHDAGIAALVTINGTPSWANGGRASAYMPTSSTAIGGFATAAALHYPWVKKWTIWNEPNQLRWLRPGSPSLYVTRLLNPAYAALHSVIPGVQVATGGTAPRAATGGLSPIAWLSGLHAAHARFDAYFGKKPIWLTEYGYQTRPPDAYLGVSWALQALYVSEAALRAYELPQVTVLIQYLYRDEPDLGAWQSGFQTVDGKIKPAFAAFRLPLAEIPGPAAATTTLWGQIRTGSGRRSYVLQELVGGRWKAVGGSRLTLATGVFEVPVDAASGSHFRVWSPRDRAYSPTLTIT